MLSNRRLGLGQTYMGRAAGLDTDGLQTKSHIPDFFFSVLLPDKALTIMVLQAPTHCWQQGHLLDVQHRHDSRHGGCGRFQCALCPYQYLPMPVSPCQPIKPGEILILQRPIKAYWDLEPKYPHTCLNDGAIVFSASTINIFTDVLTTILPMPLIWKLKLPARQRLAVIGIFGLGIIVDVAGAIRTYYVWQSMIASYDTTWKGWPVLLAATVEINLGLVCKKIPAGFSHS